MRDDARPWCERAVADRDWQRAILWPGEARNLYGGRLPWEEEAPPVELDDETSEPGWNESSAPLLSEDELTRMVAAAGDAELSLGDWIRERLLTNKGEPSASGATSEELLRAMAALLQTAVEQLAAMRAELQEVREHAALSARVLKELDQ